MRDGLQERKLLYKQYKLILFDCKGAVNEIFVMIKGLFVKYDREHSTL